KQLYCVPSVAAPGTPLQYAKIASSFSGKLTARGGFNLGYAVGDPLPIGTEATVLHHARTAIDLAGGRPYGIVGYSAGAWLAMDVVARTVDLGVPPGALILIDANLPAEVRPEHLIELVLEVFEYHRTFGAGEPEEAILNEL